MLDLTGTVDDYPSIDTVKAHQAAHAIPGHLAWLGRERFVLAHTDTERASGIPLDRCSVHRALADLDEYRGEAGYHLAEMVDELLVLTPLADDDGSGYGRLSRGGRPPPTPWPTRPLSQARISSVR